jgi:hypothetical protein
MLPSKYQKDGRFNSNWHKSGSPWYLLDLAGEKGPK